MRLEVAAYLERVSKFESIKDANTVLGIDVNHILMHHKELNQIRKYQNYLPVDLFNNINLYLYRIKLGQAYQKLLSVKVL